MSSSFADAHLTTDGGIKYKFLGMNGRLSFDDGSVTWRALVQSSDLLDFIGEVFPPPTVVGNVLAPHSMSLPGLPSMIAQDMRFKSQDSGLPIDPFSADTSLSSTAHSKTYYPTVEVEIDFAPGPRNQSDENDPFTFLEVSANATGEFINSHMPQAKWEVKRGTATIDEDTGEVGEDVASTRTDENRHPVVPIIVKVPQTEWTLRWPQISFDFFHDVMIHRLRIMMGRVNSNVIPVLYNAYPSTCLFVGFTLKQHFTWRQSIGIPRYVVGRPPVTVEFKIREKRVVWNGSIRGHNDFWRPGVGWETLIIGKDSDDNDRYAYDSIDYGLLFKV